MTKSAGDAKSARLSGGSWVAAGMMVMNVAVYGFNIVAARILVPAEFGAVTALLGVFLVGSVVAIGLQTTVARRVAIAPDRAAEEAVTSDALRITLTVAVSVAAIVCVASIAIAPLLRLDSVVPVILCGLALLPYTILGSLLGLAQGSSRWKALATIYLTTGVARLLIGAAALVISPTVTSAMLGLAIASWLPVLLGFRMLGLSLQLPHTDSLRPMMRELLGGSHALLAYFVLSSLDALIARSLFDEHDSGLYASGLILTKAALFFPQFVSVVLFPDMARSSKGGARRRALAIVAAFGALAVAATALLPGLALILVGGDKYGEIESRLWLFALEGAALAVVQLLVFDALARHAHGIVLMIWAAVGAVLVLAFSLQVNITGLVTIVATTSCVLAVAVWFKPGGSRVPAE
ncbi:hypothetical protein BH09ACT10_BH09ACT10_02310 [soil metagenome]